MNKGFICLSNQVKTNSKFSRSPAYLLPVNKHDENHQIIQKISSYSKFSKQINFIFQYPYIPSVSCLTRRVDMHSSYPTRELRISLQGTSHKCISRWSSVIHSLLLAAPLSRAVGREGWIWGGRMQTQEMSPSRAWLEVFSIPLSNFSTYAWISVVHTLNYLINEQDGISEQGWNFLSYEKQIR